MLDDETFLSDMGSVVNSLYRSTVDQHRKLQKKTIRFPDYCSLCFNVTSLMYTFTSLHIHWPLYAPDFLISQKACITGSTYKKLQIICSKLLVITKYISVCMREEKQEYF